MANRRPRTSQAHTASRSTGSTHSSHTDSSHSSSQAHSSISGDKKKKVYDAPSESQSSDSDRSRNHKSHQYSDGDSDSESDDDSDGEAAKEKTYPSDTSSDAPTVSETQSATPVLNRSATEEWLAQKGLSKGMLKGMTQAQAKAAILAAKGAQKGKLSRQATGKGRLGRQVTDATVHVIEASAWESGTIRRLPFKVENSLKAPTLGLAYRKSPDLTDKAGSELARWDTIVMGIQISPDWLQVSPDRFLPLLVNGVKILVPQVGVVDLPTMTLEEEQRQREEDAKAIEEEQERDREAGEAEIKAREEREQRAKQIAAARGSKLRREAEADTRKKEEEDDFHRHQVEEELARQKREKEKAELKNATEQDKLLEESVRKIGETRREEILKEMESESDRDREPSNVRPIPFKVRHKGGAIARTAEDLESAMVARIAGGEMLKVVEIQGNRVRIIEPLEGWTSIESKEGTQILQRWTHLSEVELQEEMATAMEEAEKELRAELEKRRARESDEESDDDSQTEEDDDEELEKSDGSQDEQPWKLPKAGDFKASMEPRMPKLDEQREAEDKAKIQSARMLDRQKKEEMAKELERRQRELLLREKEDRKKRENEESPESSDADETKKIMQMQPWAKKLPNEQQAARISIVGKGLEVPAVAEKPSAISKFRLSIGAKQKAKAAASNYEKKQQIRDQAAAKIQAKWRGKMAMNRVVLMKRQKANRAAAERKRAEIIKQREKQQREKEAAVKIQSSFRRKLAYKDVSHQRAALAQERRKKAQQEDERRQKRRAEEERQQREYERMLQREEARKQENAAVKIQAVFRGRADRKNVKLKTKLQKDKDFYEKKNRALEAQKVLGRPLRFQPSEEARTPRPWDNYSNFKPSNRNRDPHGQPLKDVDESKLGPPRPWDFESKGLTVEEDVAAMMKAVDARLNWAGTQRRLQRSMPESFREDTQRRLAVGDDIAPPGALREAALNASRSAASRKANPMASRGQATNLTTAGQIQPELPSARQRMQMRSVASSPQLSTDAHGAGSPITPQVRSPAAQSRKQRLQHSPRSNRGGRSPGAYRPLSARELSPGSPSATPQAKVRIGHSPRSDAGAAPLQSNFGGSMRRSDGEPETRVYTARETKTRRMREESDGRDPPDLSHMSGAGSCPPVAAGSLRAPYSSYSDARSPAVSPSPVRHATPPSGPSAPSGAGPSSSARVNASLRGAAPINPGAGPMSPGRSSPSPVGRAFSPSVAGSLSASAAGPASGGLGRVAAPPERSPRSAPAFSRSAAGPLSGAGAAPPRQ